MAVMTVENFMSPLAFTLSTDQSLDEAEKFLRENKMSIAPLVSARGHVVAVVTDFRLLKCFLKRSQTSIELSTLGNYLTEFEGVISIRNTENIIEGFKKMIQSPSHRVFVMDKEERVIGCLEPMGLFEFAATRSKPEAEKPA